MGLRHGSDSSPIFQVIAVLYNVGAHNVYLDKLGWGSLPAVNGDFAEVNSAFNPTYLLPASRSYFAYVGSLTSPPCTERARWVVMESPASLSPAQVAQIPNNGNFRPLQPLGSRQVATIRSQLHACARATSACGLFMLACNAGPALVSP